MRWLQSPRLMREAVAANRGPSTDLPSCITGIEVSNGWFVPVDTAFIIVIVRLPQLSDRQIETWFVLEVTHHSRGADSMEMYCWKMMQHHDWTVIKLKRIYSLICSKRLLQFPWLQWKANVPHAQSISKEAKQGNLICLSVLLRFGFSSLRRCYDKCSDTRMLAFGQSALKQQLEEAIHALK